MSAVQKLQELGVTLYQLVDQGKNLKSQKSTVLEEIEQYFDEIEQDVVPVVLPDGEKRYLCREDFISEKTDKGAIASEIGVDKKDLKGVYQFAKLTEEGRLNSKIVADNTHPDHKTKIKLTKRIPRKKNQ